MGETKVDATYRPSKNGLVGVPDSQPFTTDEWSHELVAPFSTGGRPIMSSATSSSQDEKPPGSLAAPSSTDGTPTDGRWKRAFDKLTDEEKALLLKDDDATQLSTADTSPDKIIEKVSKRLKEHDEDATVIRWSSKHTPIRLRDFGDRLIRFVMFFKPLISDACSMNPYASLAWSGATILIQLIGIPSQHKEAMIKGFVRVTDLMKTYRYREEIYLSGYLRNTDERLIEFEETVVDLYSRILSYQAAMIRHLSGNLLRRVRDYTSDNFTWETWLERIEQVDALSDSFTDVLSRTKEEEDRALTIELKQMDLHIQQKILNAQTSFLAKEIDSRRDQKETALLQSLITPYMEEKNTRRLAVTGTCLWFLKVQSFVAWRKSNHSSLIWLSAGPGCGKSVLCRSLIDNHRLRRSILSSHVYYFFFREGRHEFSTASDALRAILHQIFSLHPETRLIEHALLEYRACGDKLKESFDRLWNILMSVIKDPRAEEIVCAIDGLDECEPVSRDQFMQKIVEFYAADTSSSGPVLKFIVTSRRYSDISTAFNYLEAQGKAEYVGIDGDTHSEEVKQDIDRVLKSKVKDVFKGSTESDQANILKHLRSYENRTYLWGTLVLDSLSRFRYSSDSKIEEILKQIPAKLTQMYKEILEKLSETQDEEVTLDVLKLVVAARTPLLLEELNAAHALRDIRFDANTDLIRQTLAVKVWAHGQERAALESICGPFIQVIDDKVHLLHLTVQEFLVGGDEHEQNGGKGEWHRRFTRKTLGTD